MEAGHQGRDCQTKRLSSGGWQAGTTGRMKIS
jgi:hypothetical protein